ncbi:MAG: hypothetical protein CM1200mP30_07790 [Pseudomonadota bacterium]|nr:MAG: hypothetical protein CM1200mP30_07790 [Pseudomonadota bacterium]
MACTSALKTVSRNALTYFAAQPETGRGYFAKKNVPSGFFICKGSNVPALMGGSGGKMLNRQINRGFGCGN